MPPVGFNEEDSNFTVIEFRSNGFHESAYHLQDLVAYLASHNIDTESFGLDVGVNQ